MANKNTQNRKWAIVINNPKTDNLDPDKTIEMIKTHLTVAYCCCCEELSSSGTPHIHIYLYSPSPIRFSTIKNVFSTAHIEPAYGSSKQNREYIRKEGKWEGTHKADTKVEGTFREFGNLPSEGQEKNSEKALLLNLVKAGATTAEIIDRYPRYALMAKRIDELITAHQTYVGSVGLRKVTVIFISAPTSAVAMKYIYRKHDYKDVCRITNYGRGDGSISFDPYHGQTVLVLDNYHGQIEIDSLVIYLEPYPVYLPARYQDRVACYTDIYIISESFDATYQSNTDRKKLRRLISDYITL